MTEPGNLQPTFVGFIGTTVDALLLFEACRQNYTHFVDRRPQDRERERLIRSGSVFVFDEVQSGIKRWTDGIAWSPSRVIGNFLVYRQLCKKNSVSDRKRSSKSRSDSDEEEVSAFTVSVPVDVDVASHVNISSPSAPSLSDNLFPGSSFSASSQQNPSSPGSNDIKSEFAAVKNEYVLSPTSPTTSAAFPSSFSSLPLVSSKPTGTPFVPKSPPSSSPSTTNVSNASTSSAPINPRAPQTRRESISSTSSIHYCSSSSLSYLHDTERALVGSLTDSYGFKKSGLIKKTISLMIDGRLHHLISYYTPEDVLNGKLQTPSSFNLFQQLTISKDLLEYKSFRIPPLVEAAESEKISQLSTLEKRTLPSFPYNPFFSSSTAEIDPYHFQGLTLSTSPISGVESSSLSSAISRNQSNLSSFQQQQQFSALQSTSNNTLNENIEQPPIKMAARHSYPNFLQTLPQYMNDVYNPSGLAFNPVNPNANNSFVNLNLIQFTSPSQALFDYGEGPYVDQKSQYLQPKQPSSNTDSIDQSSYNMSLAASKQFLTSDTQPDVNENYSFISNSIPKNLSTSWNQNMGYHVTNSNSELASQNPLYAQQAVSMESMGNAIQSSAYSAMSTPHGGHYDHYAATAKGKNPLAAENHASGGRLPKVPIPPLSNMRRGSVPIIPSSASLPMRTSGNRFCHYSSLNGNHNRISARTNPYPINNQTMHFTEPLSKERGSLS
ncbi:Gluconate transporter inducer Gti1 [Schizosaccharomyces pombe]